MYLSTEEDAKHEIALDKLLNRYTKTLKANIQRANVTVIPTVLYRMKAVVHMIAIRQRV